MSESIAELLAAATAPDPTPRIKMVRRVDSVHEFLQAHDIDPGWAFSIEISALYQMYLPWATKVDGGVTRIVSPRRFARALASKGFSRKRPPLARLNGGRDRFVLMVKKESSERLLFWAKTHPTTTEQRLLFRPWSHTK